MVCILPFLRLHHQRLDLPYFQESDLGGWLVGLRLYVGGLCLLSDVHLVVYRRRYRLMLLILILVLCLCFSVRSALSYYVLFEVSLLPISYMVIVGGVRPERVSAVVFMVLFTVCGGALHLLCLIILYRSTGGLV